MSATRKFNQTGRSIRFDDITCDRLTSGTLQRSIEVLASECAGLEKGS
jgi:hypothetical protein